jgi:hypothetical protein
MQILEPPNLLKTTGLLLDKGITVLIHFGCCGKNLESMEYNSILQT